MCPADSWSHVSTGKSAAGSRGDLKTLGQAMPNNDKPTLQVEYREFEIGSPDDYVFIAVPGLVIDPQTGGLVVEPWHDSPDTPTP